MSCKVCVAVSPFVEACALLGRSKAFVGATQIKQQLSSSYRDPQQILLRVLILTESFSFAPIHVVRQTCWRADNKGWNDSVFATLTGKGRVHVIATTVAVEFEVRFVVIFRIKRKFNVQI